jgi:hypothetical protein
MLRDWDLGTHIDGWGTMKALNQSKPRKTSNESIDYSAIYPSGVISWCQKCGQDSPQTYSGHGEAYRCDVCGHENTEGRK